MWFDDSPLQAKMDWKEKIRDLKQMFEEFWERHLQRGAGLCKLHTLVALRGQKSKKNKYLRTQGRMQIFKRMFQSALNHALLLFEGVACTPDMPYLFWQTSPWTRRHAELDMHNTTCTSRHADTTCMHIATCRNRYAHSDMHIATCRTRHAECNMQNSTYT